MSFLIKLLTPIITSVLIDLINRWEADETFKQNALIAAQKAKSAVTPEEQHDARIAIQKLIAG